MPKQLTFDRYVLTLTLLEPLLGTIATSEEGRAHQISAETQDDEVAPIGEEEDRPGHTGFYVDGEGRPVIMDYQIKGWLKEIANIVKTNVEVAALRNHLEQDVYVKPRRTVLGEQVDGQLRRPLRAMTRQGPRVTVIVSDFIAAGKSYDFELLVRAGSRVTLPVLEAICEFGALRGLGQWRSAGYGALHAVVTAVEP
jgi:hypothetical protein